jgi:hypothetical protein
VRHKSSIYCFDTNLFFPPVHETHASRRRVSPPFRPKLHIRVPFSPYQKVPQDIAASVVWFALRYITSFPPGRTIAISVVSRLYRTKLRIPVPLSPYQRVPQEIAASVVWFAFRHITSSPPRTTFAISPVSRPYRPKLRIHVPFCPYQRFPQEIVPSPLWFHFDTSPPPPILDLDRFTPVWAQNLFICVSM